MTEDEAEATLIEIVPKNELQVLVQNSGLEQTKAQFMLEQFTDHYKMAAEWAKKAKKIIVTNEHQTVDMKMARTGRLFLREKRLEIETARKALKEQSLREGKAIDMIANFLKDLIIPTEAHLDRMEHFVEYKKKAEDERILAEAHAKSEAERIVVELANQIELQQLREQQAELIAKQQAEAKAEADRLKKEESLKKADDSVKLAKFLSEIMTIKLPEGLKSADSRNKVNSVKILLKEIEEILITEEEII